MFAAVQSGSGEPELWKVVAGTRVKCESGRMHVRSVPGLVTDPLIKHLEGRMIADFP